MNQFDRDNLNFLLNADEKDMDEWYHYATDDDFDYALEIIRAARAELELEELALLDEEVEYMTKDNDLPEAKLVLSKFTLQ